MLPKILASHLHAVLSSVIDSEQTFAVNNWSIQDNLCMVRLIIE